MIRSLRKRHLNMWLIIAVLLPLGFIAAVFATPQSLAKGALDVPEKGKLLKQMTMDWGPVELRGLPDSSQMIQFKVTTAIKTAAVAVYLGKKPIDHPTNGQFLKKLDSRGLYEAKLDKAWFGMTPHLLFYDPIKQEVVAKSFW